MRQRQWKPRSRLRRALRRSSVVWWTAALVLGALTASITATSIGRATAAANAWGTSQRVWVVQRSVGAGDVVGAPDVTLARRPTGVIPRGALDAPTSPVGHAARVRLAVGEVVLADRITGRAGLAAMLDRGRRAIALKNDESMPALQPGDRVDVLATFDVGDAAEGDASAAPTFAVASDAEVLSVSPRTVTLAVTSREAPRVAFALARAAVAVSLRGG